MIEIQNNKNKNSNSPTPATRSFVVIPTLHLGRLLEAKKNAERTPVVDNGKCSNVIRLLFPSFNEMKSNVELVGGRLENCDNNNDNGNNNTNITISENTTIITSSSASSSTAETEFGTEKKDNNNSNSAAALNEKIKETEADINVGAGTQNTGSGIGNNESCSSSLEVLGVGGGGGAGGSGFQLNTIATQVVRVTVEGDSNGENAVVVPMIRLPENLECLIRADSFPNQRHRWNTNEEIAAILISFNRHPEWLSKEVKIRPKSGSVLLYSRKKVRYRRDGYCWKKRKDGKTTREDHMKLKVQGTECIYGCYVHSAILPTFHRRCYWLLQNPDIVLVHYLNVPYPDDNKLIITSNVSMWGDKKEWTKEELISQLKPMFFSEEEPDLNNKLELSTAETVEAIVHQLMEKQRLARQSVLLDGSSSSSSCPTTNVSPAAIGSTTAPTVNLSSLTTTTTLQLPSLTTNTLTNHTTTNGVLHDILASAASCMAAAAASTPSTMVTVPTRLSSTSSLSPASSSSSSTSPSLHNGLTVTVAGSGSITSLTKPLTIQLPAHLTPSSLNTAPASSTPTTNHHTIMSFPNSPIKLTNNNLNSSSNNNAASHHIISNGIGSHHLIEHHPIISTGSTSTTITGHHPHRVTLQNLNTGGLGGNDHRPFVLNLSQFQSVGGGLIILNGKPPSTAVTATATQQTLTTAQNVSNGASATIATASLMDIQNANNNIQGRTNLLNCTSDSTLATNISNNTSSSSSSSNNTSFISNSNQTLFIHHHHHPGQQQQQQTQFGSAILSTVSSNTAAANSTNNIGSRLLASIQQQQQQQLPITARVISSSSLSGQLQSHGSSSVLLSDHSHYSSSPSPPPIQSSHQQQQVGYYTQETLDMSHEDIQQTLSANMSHMVDATVDLEPMSPSADDVFINLDAFDILADLSDDLEQHHTSSSSIATTGQHNHHHLHQNSTINLIHSSDKNTIVDINPEWAYSEGGTKILIVGQFNNPDWDYIVHFGDFPVPAVYLQTGVLKCFCPPHSPGLVPIRVYSNGKQISTNSMVFEYKVDLKVNLVQVPPSETSLKLCLIHRMECVETCFRNFKSDLFGVKSLEDCVVKLCCEMMAQEWSPNGPGSQISILPSPDRGLTLLHLSAALGYTRLLFTLIQWKRENPAPVLDLEVCPLRTDDFGLSPLMWCARYGHLECGIILAQWSPQSLTKRDFKGRSPVQIAISRGHGKLATELEKIQTSRNCSTNTGKTNSLSSKAYCGGGAGGIGNQHDLDSSEACYNFTTLERFQRSMMSSVSEDFGLKDCFFGQPDTTLALAMPSEEESRVLTLAEQIIAAMPERIKKESCEEMSPGESLDSSSMMSSDQSDQNEFSFEFSDRHYRYYDSGTPCSSLSPSSSCLQSPCSSSFTVDSPQPTTADFCEFLQASAFEKDFSNLTLSDREQRELYEAAKVIQKAYRSYKGRKKLEEEEKEKLAAIIIQNYYRRYKQYAYLRQVTDAALVIQNQYRNYCENKRFKKSQEHDTIGFRQPSANSQSALRALSQRKQNQAAKKIQQFMRQSKNQLQKERAEKEKQQC